MDTGASNTFICSSILNRTRHATIVPIKERFSLADGNTSVCIDGKVEIYVQIGNITTNVMALISKSLSTPCILGQDWLQKYLVDICHSKKQIVVHSAKSSSFISMETDVNNQMFDAKLANTIVIKPQHTIIAKLKSPISSSLNAIFQPNQHIQHKNLIAIPNALLSIENFETYITITNPTNNVCRLLSNTKIGQVVTQTDDISCYSINPSDQDIQREAELEEPTQKKKTIHDDHLQVDFLLDHIQDTEERMIIRNLLNTFWKVFDISKPTISTISAPPMINTGKNPPIQSRVYRTDLIKQQHLSKTIDEMLESGQIEKSHASWSSPVLLVKKKDGSYRFVVDYRQLNNVTERDCYPLPRIEDTLNRLNGHQLFTKMDLRSGYHQIRIHPDDKDRTTFTTYNGLFRFNVMPQGLTNSPSNFQRIMYELLVNTRWQYCLVYIDDILIFSHSFQEHMQHLNEILSVLSKANLQLNPHKCSFAKSSIDYLGHTINSQGIAPLQENIKAIMSIPTPTTPKQVHSFVQIANYYRDFIENFSKIAAPLFVYTQKNAIWKGWNDKMEKAFNELKARLTTPPIFLNFPDDTSPLVLSSDASGEGMGGVLRQLTPSGVKVIKYVSKKFSLAQKRYSTTERECLAMVWCIQKLKEYIWGRPIEIETDHCPLCSFNKKKIQNSRIERWQLELSEYNITKIRYKKGLCNCDADLLSRFPCEEPDADDENHSTTFRLSSQPIEQNNSIQINAITRSMAKQLSNDIQSSNSNSETTRTNIDSNDEINLTNTSYNSSLIIDLSLERIREEQMKDPEMKDRVQRIGENPQSIHNEIMDQGVLFKLITRQSRMTIQLPWIPTSLISEVLRAYHDHPMSGHFGITRTYLKIKDKYYWPNMYNTIKKYIRSCAECAQFNVHRQKKPGLLQQEQPPEGVFQVLQMDFWRAPVRSNDGNQYVLIITDRLSKYVFARALPSATAKDTAEMLMEDIILKHGAIRCLQSDQGSHFKNELLSSTTQLIGCKQIFSIPYHPMSNGQVERFNSTFCDQLKKYCNDNLNDWDVYLQSIVWAYNSGTHATTNFIPYELAFNRRLISPFETKPSTIQLWKPHDYWEMANQFRQVAIRAAQANIVQNQILSKRRYDSGRANPHYNEGDLVWVKVLTNRSKFDCRFHGPFTIIKKINDVKYIIEHTEELYTTEEHVNNFLPFYDRK